jgi:hypothetical protein
MKSRRRNRRNKKTRKGGMFRRTLSLGKSLVKEVAKSTAQNEFKKGIENRDNNYRDKENIKPVAPSAIKMDI